MPQNFAGFNPRLPGGRRLRRMFPIVDLTIRFNPRLPGGRRPRRRSNRRDSHTFQSTPSGGKATLRGNGFRRHIDWVSIHAFRGEGDSLSIINSHHFQVSIHAFRGEGDSPQRGYKIVRVVSIHAFRGEGDSSDSGLSSI